MPCSALGTHSTLQSPPPACRDMLSFLSMYNSCQEAAALGSYGPGLVAGSLGDV